jgi:chemotaxis signal transduction protein
MFNREPENNLVLPGKVLQKRFTIPVTGSHDNVQKNESRVTSFTSYAFMAGDLGLMLESEKVVSEVMDMLPMCTLPNAPSWLYSMANLRGNITPIFNLLDIFEYQNVENIENKKILIIGTKEQAVGLIIDEIPFRIELSEDNKVDVIADLPFKLLPFVRNCYEKNSALWIDWDVDGFFKSLKLAC